MSDKFYQHCIILLIKSMEQGSSNFPGIWCSVSSIQCDCHTEKAHGATYETPDKSLSIPIYVVGFVDDSMGQTNFLQ